MNEASTTNQAINNNIQQSATQQQINNQQQSPVTEIPQLQTQGDNSVPKERILQLSQGIDAERLKMIEPHLVGYIQEDVKAKQSMQSTIDSQVKEIEALRSQIGRINDVTLLAQYGFEAGEYDDIRRLCDYSITPEKLIRLSKNAKYSYLLNKRETQKAQKEIDDNDILFSEFRKEGYK